MIDSVGSKPFSARGLPPIDKPSITYADEIINLSRQNYAKKVEEVENDIKDWFTIHNDAKIDEPVVKKDYRPKYEHKNSSYKDYDNLKSFASEINSTSASSAISPVGEKKEFIKETNKEFNNDSNRDQNRESTRSHTRSRYDNRRERDTRDVDMSRVREGESQKREEVKENKFALKDAIEKAMGSQKMRVEKIEEEIKKEEKSEEQKEHHKEYPKKESVVKEEILETKEIPEKILRDLVDEE